MEDRRARIAALRAKAGRALARSTEDTATTGKSSPVLQVVALVNTAPTKKKQKGEEGKKEESVLVRALRQAQQEASRIHPASMQGDDLAPQKINADLKLEIQPKLEKLEKRTQRAIVALLRERLEQEAAAEVGE